MSETTGQRPTNKNTYFEDGQWCYAGSKRKEGERQTLESYLKKNKNRMYVDGKYVPKSHPLHKPGHYKGFTDVAFDSIEGYRKSKKGYIYIIHNPSFPGWYKVGMAVDVKDRLNNFQTGSPYRNYKLLKYYAVEDRKEAEKKAHKILGAKNRRREWFYTPYCNIVKKLDNLLGVQVDCF